MEGSEDGAIAVLLRDVVEDTSVDQAEVAERDQVPQPET